MPIEIAAIVRYNFIISLSKLSKKTQKKTQVSDL